jgi:peptide-methionine (R)-S-oxide reductase
MDRRSFLLTLATAPMALQPSIGRAAAALDAAAIEDMRKTWKSLLPKNADVPASPAPISRSNESWKQLLTPAQYEVLRQEGTEPAFTSPLNAEKRPGVFVCVGCALPLFTSRMKYDSGTGWPSFFTSIPDHLGTKTDFKLILPRTEYHCLRCGGHQGHVFDDGPPPTRERWCNNGVALRFLPA